MLFYESDRRSFMFLYSAPLMVIYDDASEPEKGS